MIKIAKPNKKLHWKKAHFIIARCRRKPRCRVALLLRVGGISLVLAVLRQFFLPLISEYGIALALKRYYIIDR